MTLTKPHTFTARKDGYEASASCPIECWVTVFWMIDLPRDVHRANWSIESLRASGYHDEAARKIVSEWYEMPKDHDETTERQLVHLIAAALKARDVAWRDAVENEPELLGAMPDEVWKLLLSLGMWEWKNSLPEEKQPNRGIDTATMFIRALAEKPAPTPKAEPKPDQSGDTADMIPWPKDLNELVGKRIRTRMNKAHHLHAALGDRAEMCEVLGIVVDEPDWLVVSMSPSGTYLRTTIRDLLSIEPMPPPKPADEIDRLTTERDAWKDKAKIRADEADSLTSDLAAANERAESMFTGKQVVEAIHAVMPRVPKWDHPNDTNWIARLVIEALNDTPEPPATGASPSDPPAQQEYPQ